MVVLEILPDAKKVFALCETPSLFRLITRSVELLANESVAWDAMVRCLRLTTEDDGTFALPQEVETPLGVNLDGHPAFNRDKWFVHHINGPGEFSSIDGWRRFWDDVGDSATIRPIGTATKLKVDNIDPIDDLIELRIFGVDDSGNPLKTGDENGIGIKTGTLSTVLVGRIDYITKPETEDVITLKQEDNTLLGSYCGLDTYPRFRIVRFPRKTVVTIQYRVRNLKITSVTDYIPLDNTNAFIASMRAIKYLDDDKTADFEKYLSIAIRLANSEQETRNAQSAIGPQVQNMTIHPGSSLWNRRGRRRGC